MVVFLVVGFIGLGRFSGRVRNVDAVGLFASGMIAGAGLTGLFRGPGR